MESQHKDHWSSKWAFILAAAGAAVGLGNIWKFPYITGENGGGAFVLVYLGCVLIAGVPIMMSEILMGRRSRRNPAGTFEALAEDAGSRSPRLWRLVGLMGILAGVIILSFYSVIAGWAMDYVFHAFGGAFNQITPGEAKTLFTNLMASPWQLLVWHSLVMLATASIVARGVQKGLEPVAMILLPAMLVLMLLLLAYGMTSGYFMEGIRFLFHPRFDRLTPDSILDAVGHAFFTLSLGLGTIMAYGSYLPKHISITRVSFWIAGADTCVALLAGMVIFPIVFAHGLTPGSGPGLIFETLPITFGKMGSPWGGIISSLFFLMLVFAAFTSAISLLEPCVAWLIETRKMSRHKATIVLSTVIWLLGIASLLSFNQWSELKFFGMTVFDCLDYITANFMLPVGGLLIAIFAGWVMPESHTREELGLKNEFWYRGWRFIIRYPTPLAITILLLYSWHVIKL